jgi:hypothetical protein
MNRVSDAIENHPYWQYSPDAAEKLGAIRDRIMQDFGFNTDPGGRPNQGYGAYGGLSGFGTVPGVTGWSGGDATGMPTGRSPGRQTGRREPVVRTGYEDESPSTEEAFRQYNPNW